MKKWLSLLMLMMSACLLTNCSLYKKPAVPAMSMPQQFKYANGKNTIITLHWWENFNDPNLNHLVQLALKNNNSYLIALKNIDIAKTYVTQNYSALFPSFALNYNVSSQQLPSPYFAESSANQVSIQSLTAATNYQIDLWHQLGNAYNQSKSTLTGTKAQTKNTQIALINSVVTTYFQVMTSHNTLKNLKQQEKVAQTIVALYAVQLKSGFIDSSTLDDAKTQLQNIQFNRAINQKQLAVFENTLAYLVGEYPERFHLPLSNHILHIPYEHFIPSNLSSTLIMNRPDVAYTYNQVLSAGYVKKQSIAGFLPVFNMTGLFGYSGTGLSNFLMAGDNTWSIALAVAEPIINIETNIATYRRAKFQYQSAVMSYKDTVINAFKDIDNALITYKKDHQALRFYGDIVSNDQDKLRIAKAQYRIGYADYASMLNSQITLLQNQNNFVAQHLIVITDVAKVYQTLGV